MNCRALTQSFRADLKMVMHDLSQTQTTSKTKLRFSLGSRERVPTFHK